MQRCADCQTIHNGSHSCVVVPKLGSIITYSDDIPNLAGSKHDQEKPDLSLLPPEFLNEVALAFMHGEKKYGRYNFTGGLQWTRLGAAIMRHTTAWLWGEEADTESGLHHLAHAGAGIAMALMHVRKGLGQDNRYKRE